MALLYADEDFHYGVVERLRHMGHNILTVQEAGRSGDSDPEVLATATTANRAVLTFNRRHFERLDRLFPGHAGIISCKRDDVDPDGLADRINQTIAAAGSLAGRCLRVNRPPGP
jgi:Domain of unknown function (DUF5615)